MNEPFDPQNFDPRYVGYFECFNRQQFFEAHEVLEQLWLPERKGPNAAFYQGLIQLAGAFVHLQKARWPAAASLFKKAAANLSRYPPLYQGLDLEAVRRLISSYLRELESAALGRPPPDAAQAPKLSLHGC